MSMRSVYFGDLGQRNLLSHRRRVLSSQHTTDNSALAGEAASPDEDERSFVVCRSAGPTLRAMAAGMNTPSAPPEDVSSCANEDGSSCAAGRSGKGCSL